jgi:hypothetical protein
MKREMSMWNRHNQVPSPCDPWESAVVVGRGATTLPWSGSWLGVLVQYKLAK